ncbi:hypothetical protein B9Z55_025477 [Caenorhabditis nigoni]|uniref:Uncharacterized protein n=1 Tax=Caenorhabditis nigoni TaxID=1611254 RepID=A0A2G5SYS6_9PELO|nr:hypothetical protein B9Z55_025477 [Caenorhabditis nigoni]
MIRKAARNMDLFKIMHKIRIEDVDLHVFLFNPKERSYIPQLKRKAARKNGSLQDNAHNSQAQFPYESGGTREKSMERTMRQNQKAPEEAD